RYNDTQDSQVYGGAGKEDPRTDKAVASTAGLVMAKNGYAVSTEFDPERAGPWVRANVLPKLPPPASKTWQSRAAIRDGILDFLTAGPGDIELWAWVAAYDHVALCQLWGPMTALPRSMPRFTR
ncbi:hypothetical protein PJI23_29615, partial [Mycobacterium kansasii]